MKRFSRSGFARAALTAAVVLLAEPLLAQAAADVAGEWDVTINSPQGTSQALLTLKKEGDNWTGTWKSPRGERQLQDVTFKGNELRFAMKVTLQGQEAVFTYTGTLEKGAMKGTADFGGLATGDWSAVRHTAAPASPASPAVAPPVDISGTWLFNVETGAGSGQPTFTFQAGGGEADRHLQRRVRQGEPHGHAGGRRDPLLVHRRRPGPERGDHLRREGADEGQHVRNRPARRLRRRGVDRQASVAGL